MLVYISRRNGAFFRDYGRVLHDQAIYGVKPEGKLSVTYDKQTFFLPDGETYELCKPNYTITEWYKDSIAPEDLFCTVRIRLRHARYVTDDGDRPQGNRSARCQKQLSGIWYQDVATISPRRVSPVSISGNKARYLDLTVELGLFKRYGRDKTAAIRKRFAKGRLRSTKAA